MSVHHPRRRIGLHLPVMLALALPSLMAGCGGGGSAPAPVDAAQTKKVQEYMKSYKQQLIAEAKAQAKAKAAEKKSH